MAAQANHSPTGSPSASAPAIPSVITGFHKTWSEVVKRKEPAKRSTLSDEFLEGKVHISFSNGEEGEPVVDIDMSVIDILAEAWINSITFKPLGIKIQCEVLFSKLQDLWNLHDAFELIDIAKGYFIARFNSRDDCMRILTGGPWCVFGRYLVLREWTKDFDPFTNRITSMPVWVRIKNLPLIYYDGNLLMKISAGIGKPIRVDMKTLLTQRRKYAKFCVNLDITKAIKNSLIVRGVRFELEFENLHAVCLSCGYYGHFRHQCPLIQGKISEDPPKKMAVNKAAGNFPVRKIWLPKKPTSDASEVGKLLGNPPEIVAGENQASEQMLLRVVEFVELDLPTAPVPLRKEVEMPPEEPPIADPISPVTPSSPTSSPSPILTVVQTTLQALQTAADSEPGSLPEVERHTDTRGKAVLVDEPLITTISVNDAEALSSRFKAVDLGELGPAREKLTVDFSPSSNLGLNVYGPSSPARVTTSPIGDKDFLGHNASGFKKGFLGPLTRAKAHVSTCKKAPDSHSSLQKSKSAHTSDAHSNRNLT